MHVSKGERSVHPSKVTAIMQRAGFETQALLAEEGLVSMIDEKIDLLQGRLGRHGLTQTTAVRKTRPFTAEQSTFFMWANASGFSVSARAEVAKING